MKIAILSDLHLGYARFEADSYSQAASAVSDASAKADILLCAGDIFDIKIPRLETLKWAVDIFRKSSVPVFAIHGNHERRARDMINPVQLLSASAGLRLLHGESAVFEKGGEKLQVLGMGSVPEEYASMAVKKVMEGFRREDGAFSLLMIHQSIRELVPGGKEELSLEELEALPFDLIVNGHIHETTTMLGGKFLIPGSTVITQLKKEEMAPRGYFLYDTLARKAEFVSIPSRRFFYEELEFKEASETDVRERVRERIAMRRQENPGAIIAIKLDGTLKGGLIGADVRIESHADVFIDNRLNVESLGAKLEKIRSGREASLSMREGALRELKAKTEGKVTLFDASDIFDKLLSGPEETLEYLEKHNKKSEG
ncbi:metallophosphoesterase family protein [Candidatus Micrarchaeota archaeon]|nr:metallophosphoesterase family protein [Candidatus Micrarchaeota archaeon]